VIRHYANGKLQEVKKVGKPVLIVYGTAEEEVSAADVELSTKALASAGVPHDVIPIAGADHIYTRYEAEQEVIAVTVAWLQRTL
jgi:dipeptidyl-peptidase-4